MVSAYEACIMQQTDLVRWPAEVCRRTEWM